MSEAFRPRVFRLRFSYYCYSGRTPLVRCDSDVRRQDHLPFLLSWMLRRGIGDGKNKVEDEINTMVRDWLHGVLRRPWVRDDGLLLCPFISSYHRSTWDNYVLADTSPDDINLKYSSLNQFL